VVNPNIFVDDQKLDMKNSIFNNKCFKPSVVPSYEYQYDPPIFFEETNIPPQTTKLSETPIKLIVNNILIDGDFELINQTDSNIVYKSKDTNKPKTRVEFSKNNVQGITVRQSAPVGDIAKINALKPFVPEKKEDAFSTILPRIASMFSMLSPGGGAAA